MSPVVSEWELSPVHSTRHARAVTLALLPLVGAVLGLSTALLWPTPHGSDHSCPAEAPASACFYPPDLLRQRVGYLSLVGLAIGAFPAWLAWAFSSVPHQPASADQGQ